MAELQTKAIGELSRALDKNWARKALSKQKY